MSRRLRCMAAGVLSALVALASIELDGQTGAKNGEWRFYGGDAGSTKYSPLIRSIGTTSRIFGLPGDGGPRTSVRGPTSTSSRRP